MPQNNTSEAFEALKECMVNNYHARIVSGGKEILKRCHFCGDSSDPSNAHMYIGIKDGAILYNCFKCNASGIVDGRFLRNMGCYDPNITLLCQTQNKKYSNPNSSRYGEFRSIYTSKNLYIPISTNEFAVKKLQYLSNRFGHVFNAYDAVRFKIILNLKEFLLANGITKYTRHPDMVDLIDKFFVGFLSMDNRYVLLRRLVPEGKLPKFIDHRYINYDIFGVQEGMKYYTIPTSIYPYLPLDIHIAEGAFDIISIYMHVAPIGSNAIFSAIGGKSYLALVRFFIVNYGFSGFNLHLYPDADISNSKMQEIKEDIKPFNIKVFVHRNALPNEKDFGVSMDRISDIFTKI